MEEKIISMEKYLISKKHKNIKSRKKIVNEELETIPKKETNYQKELMLKEMKKIDEEYNAYIIKSCLLMVLTLIAIIIILIII